MGISSFVSTEWAEIGVFVRCNIPIKPYDTSHLILNGIEQLWITFKFNNKCIGIGILYKPPVVHYINLDGLDLFHLGPTDLVIMGDFDIDLLKVGHFCFSS